jgi:hypothetical protein
MTSVCAFEHTRSSPERTFVWPAVGQDDHRAGPVPVLGFELSFKFEESRPEGDSRRAPLRLFSTVRPSNDRQILLGVVVEPCFEFDLFVIAFKEPQHGINETSNEDPIRSQPCDQEEDTQCTAARTPRRRASKRLREDAHSTNGDAHR